MRIIERFTNLRARSRIKLAELTPPGIEEFTESPAIVPAVLFRIMVHQFDEAGRDAVRGRKNRRKSMIA